MLRDTVEKANGGDESRDTVITKLKEYISISIIQNCD